MNNQKLWIYRSDALRHQVGDGSVNPEISPDESSSDDDEEEDDNECTEDWVPLKFAWPPEDRLARASYATTRCPHDRMRLQRPDQLVLGELLPDQYLATPAARMPSRPFGGLIGELPILVALIAYSVRQGNVDGALTQCLRRNYRPHNRLRGEGCKSRKWTL